MAFLLNTMISLVDEREESVWHRRFASHIGTHTTMGRYARLLLPYPSSAPLAGRPLPHSDRWTSSCLRMSLLDKANTEVTGITISLSTQGI